MMGTPALSNVYIWRLNSISSSASTLLSIVSRCHMPISVFSPVAARESVISVGVMPVFSN